MRIRQIIRFAVQAPATSLVFIVSLVLYLGVVLTPLLDPTTGPDIASRWGGVEHFIVGPPAGQRPGAEVPLSGPFELWDGQWWRVAVSAFHHGDLHAGWDLRQPGFYVTLVHLIPNLLGLLWLGGLAEPRFGRLRMFIWLPTATVLSLIPEFLVGNSAVGISGGLCALFGMLLVMRQDDDGLQEELPTAVVRVVLGSLVAAWILTESGAFTQWNFAVANICHFTGLAYGWLTGWMFCSDTRRPLTLRGAFVAAHLLVWPGLYYSAHPMWNAQYQWYLAYRSDRPADQIEHLTKAVRLDPSLGRAWGELAVVYHRRKEDLAAWSTLLQGLSYNRLDQPGIEFARFLWLQFPTEVARKTASEELKRVFGSEADAWRDRLKLDQLTAQFPRNQEPGGVLFEGFGPPIQQRPLGRIEPGGLIPGMPVSPGPKPRDLRAPPVNPDQPGSASEGVSL